MCPEPQTVVGEGAVAARPNSDAARAGRPSSQDGKTSVRLQMSLSDAQQIRDALMVSRGSPAARAIQDALWLRVVLVEYSRRLGGAERARFERRADSILGRLVADPRSDVLSETTRTVVRRGKR
jgi:hypothetical protein